MVEAVLFVKEKTGMDLKQSKEYVDTKRIEDNTEYTKNEILNEKTSYKRGFLIDGRMNILSSTATFLDKTSLVQMFFCFFLIISFFLASIFLYYL